MVLELARSRVGPEIVTEVVAIAVAEVIKPDLVDVGCIGSVGDVDCAYVCMYFVPDSVAVYC